MSIEVETDQTVVPQPPASEMTTRRAATVKPRWRQRNYQIAGVALLAVLIGAFVANNLIASQHTPDGAVREYFSAIQSGDAAKAWYAIQIAAPTVPASAKYLDRSALEAALAAGKPEIRSFSVTSTKQVDSGKASIEVAYATSSGSKEAKFITQRSGQTDLGIYPVWHLVITPTILQITVPKGSNGVNIDGKSIALPDGKSMIAVLPLIHKVQFNGTAMLATQTITVDAFQSQGQAITFQPTLTAAGLDRAKAAIKTAFGVCAQKTASNAASDGSCPQSASMNRTTTGQWRVVGDPGQDLTVNFDQSLNAFGVGHYQMVIAYEDRGTQHEVAAGGYRASLVLAPADITVGSIAPMRDAPGLKRPDGATDQAVKDLVTQGFAQCAKSDASLVADCPQYLIDVMTSNISWSMSGDPLAGATITFDSADGIISVQGNVPMTATYLSGRTPKSRPSFTRTYVAYLLWDGQALQLVTIVGGI